MDLDHAFSFLRKHQPLPSDDNLSIEDIRTLDKVRQFLTDNPYPESIPFLLNVFGEGSGFGVYQLLEDTLITYDSEDVVPYLIKSLQSEHQGIRYWSAQIASSFPDQRLIKPLSSLVEERNSDIRLEAYVAWGEISDTSILAILKGVMKSEEVPEVYEILEDIFGIYELLK